ncbi:MAG: hypothetical protein KM310_10390 [Clostridiales bacterium]|nr:hypothetical protein [Clostridiales bacterium]
MSREVHVVVGKNGRLETDFRGFLDDDCLLEADRLGEALKALGLSANLVDRVMKDMAQRLREAGEAEALERKATGTGRDA